MMPPKIQPIDIDVRLLDSQIQTVWTDLAKLVLKSCMKRLFERQFPGVPRNNSAPSDKTDARDAHFGKDGAAAAGEFDLSSLCLYKMVQNFIKESNERQPSAKYSHNRYDCINGNNDSSDDEVDIFDGFNEFPNARSFSDASDVPKRLIPCMSAKERKLLADTVKILEKNMSQKRKDDLRQIVVESLSFNDYNSSICKSKWDKSPAFYVGTIPLFMAKLSYAERRWEEEGGWGGIDGESNVL